MILEIKKSSDISRKVEQKLETDDCHEIKPDLYRREDFFSKLFGTDILESNGKEFDKKGGSYGEVFRGGEGDKYEVHHMPADSVSYLEKNDGPAIKMEKADHKLTASCGMSKEAREYRLQQQELLIQGKFREALQMDIDDIHEKFGDKYNEAITEMLLYVDKLEQEGRLNG